MNPPDLRHSLTNGGIDTMPQGDIGEPATLTTSRHSEIHDIVDQVDEVDSAAMTCHDGVDLLVEDSAYALAKMLGRGH